jgi:hypothetical protein
MRKAFVFVIAVGMSAFIAAPVVAGVVKLSGTHTRDEIKTTCKKNGGTFDGNGGVGSDYVCVGKGGTVYCKNDGTCAGVCDNCGGKAAPGKGGMGGVLTNTPGAKAQPLRPQQVTTSPGRATPQHVTRSPKTAQPLTAQKTTASPRAASPSSTGASQPLRRNSH